MGIQEMFDEAPPLPGMSLDEMVTQYIRLDQQIKELAIERSAFNSALCQNASDIRN